jgi:hypothetical protein
LKAWLILPLWLAACGFPRDPGGSLEAARLRGTLRAGLADPDTLSEERRTLEGFARSLGLSVTWTPGTTSALLTALEERRLDVVAADLDAKDPWGSRVGFSRPWRVDPDGRRRVFAVPSGENALLTALDRFCLEPGAAP